MVTFHHCHHFQKNPLKAKAFIFPSYRTIISWLGDKITKDCSLQSFCSKLSIKARQITNIKFNIQHNLGLGHSKWLIMNVSFEKFFYTLLASKRNVPPTALVLSKKQLIHFSIRTQNVYTLEGKERGADIGQPSNF